MSKYEYNFPDSISSPDGEYDAAVDLTGVLETSETLNAPTAISLETTILEVTLAAVNTIVIVKEDGGTIAIGKGIVMHIKTLKQATVTVGVEIKWSGNSGSADTHTIGQHIVPTK